MHGEEVVDNLGLIDENDFYSPYNKDIFNQIVKVYKELNVIDFAIIMANLSDDTRKSAIMACEEFVTIHSFPEHLKVLKVLSQKRRLTNRISQLAFNDFELNDLKKIIDDEQNQKGFVNVEEKNKKNIETFEDGLNKQKPRIMTGMSSIDKTTGGIRKGCVFYLGARPSTGKTSLAINISCNQKHYNQKVMFFSLEMSSEMIFERMVASQKSINYNHFSTQSLNDAEQKITLEYMAELKEKSEFVVIDDIYTIEGICNAISEYKPDFVVVDFMQIVSTAQRHENVRVKVDYISSEFKRIAKSVNCSIMVLSQLSRSGKDAPTMSELKESGALEADGDYIALLHRPYVLKKDDPSVDPEKTELLLDKNKFGRTGKVELRFDLKHQKFYEIEYNKEPVFKSVESFMDDEEWEELIIE
jgi:replicative DNA helicase